MVSTTAPLIVLLMAFLIVATALRSVKYPLPIVLWHGMGDSCCDPKSLGYLKEIIEETLPGVDVISIRTGPTEDDDRKSSFFGRIDDQVTQVCHQLASDSRLKHGFNAIGFSQGGQMLRAYVQRCNLPAVRRLITFGSQHGGVADIPSCQGQKSVWCSTMRWVVSHGAYTPSVQERVIQAQYYKDPKRLDVYLEQSLFLADINNERSERNKTYAKQLASLDRFVMILFEDDQMVVPKESAWFGFYADATRKSILRLQDQLIYTEDWIGLKQLDEEEKLVFLTVPGQHMQIAIQNFKAILLAYCAESQLEIPSGLMHQRG